MQNTSPAVIAQRAEGNGGLDDFPAPPWATWALVENVLGSDKVRELTCLEPELD
jgi:hypothetical protein